MVTMPQSKMPHLRFKGFSEEWEKKQLGDIADIIGGGTPSTSIAEYWGGNIDWYSPTEIGNQVYANGSVKKITQLGLEKSSAKILPSGKTILFTSRAGIGNMAILSKDGATNQGFQSLILRDKYDTYFVYSAGFLIKKYALKYSSGSTFLEISGKQLSNMNIIIPDIEEQTKIGDYFQRLDALIEQKEKKYQKLKQFKTAMLSQLFPKEGEHTPKLRFKGFSGEWEEKKLDDLPIYISDGNYGELYPTSNDFKSEGIPFLRANNIKNLKIDDSDTKYISIEQHSILTSGHLLTNDILITTRGDLGNLALIDNKHNGSNINAQICLLRVSEENKLNYLYLLYILDFKDSKKQYKALETGTALKQLPKGNLVKLKLKIPLIKEQTKIGNYFQKLDTLIDLHQQELEKLKTMKKALLAKMFV